MEFGLFESMVLTNSATFPTLHKLKHYTNYGVFIFRHFEPKQLRCKCNFERLTIGFKLYIYDILNRTAFHRIEASLNEICKCTNICTKFEFKFNLMYIFTLLITMEK